MYVVSRKECVDGCLLLGFLCQKLKDLFDSNGKAVREVFAENELKHTWQSKYVSYFATGGCKGSVLLNH